MRKALDKRDLPFVKTQQSIENLKKILQKEISWSPLELILVEAIQDIVINVQGVIDSCLEKIENV